MIYNILYRLKPQNIIDCIIFGGFGVGFFGFFYIMSIYFYNIVLYIDIGIIAYYTMAFLYYFARWSYGEN